jgi:hypothetical protein
MARAKKEKALIDFATKKTVHVSMSVASHAGLRIACFNNKISMQEALEEFAHLVSIGHPDTLAILKSVSIRKIQDQIKKLDNTDTETIYDILELESPLRDR